MVLPTIPLWLMCTYKEWLASSKQKILCNIFMPWYSCMLNHIQSLKMLHTWSMWLLQSQLFFHLTMQEGSIYIHMLYHPTFWHNYNNNRSYGCRFGKSIPWILLNDNLQLIYFLPYGNGPNHKCCLYPPT